MAQRLHRFLSRRLGAVATIALAQLFGTSLWFSANGAAADVMRAWDVGALEIGWLTSAVQAGFILGTLAISLSGYADRFRASSIFTVSALAGACFNAGFAWLAQGMAAGLAYRFLVGICLAGIYPMGMKLIVRWAPDRAGWALAQLVAMLTMGTALPHILKILGTDMPWRAVITASSVLAVLAACLVAALGDNDAAAGPAPGAPRPGAGRGWQVFRLPAFRAAATGYFGHMWELYAFWTVVPLYVAATDLPRTIGLGSGPGGVSVLAFAVIAAGALGCVAGGALSRRLGSARVAAGALALSGSCCLIFALGWRDLPGPALLIVLLAWGAAVIADSPHFSALSAQACPAGQMGSALALQNSIGFAITVISISATVYAFERIGADSAWVLLPGPALGLLAFLRPGLRPRPANIP